MLQPSMTKSVQHCHCNRGDTLINVMYHDYIMSLIDNV